MQSDDDTERLRLACRLAEKAWSHRLQVYVHTAEADESRLDDLLWTFRQGSFVPHARAAERPDPAPPVLIGSREEPETHHGLLINLAPEVPLFFSRFERVAEIIDQAPERLDAGRERFRFYRDRGYELQTHKLEA